VIWSNQGKRPHTIASNDDSWHATLQPNESFGLTFADKGTYKFRVDIKSEGSIGVIVVK
jgi:plastocyanin